MCPQLRHHKLSLHLLPFFKHPPPPPAPHMPGHPPATTSSLAPLTLQASPLVVATLQPT